MFFCHSCREYLGFLASKRRKKVIFRIVKKKENCCITCSWNKSIYIKKSELWAQSGFCGLIHLGKASKSGPVLKMMSLQKLLTNDNITTPVNKECFTNLILGLFFMKKRLHDSQFLTIILYCYILVEKSGWRVSFGEDSFSKPHIFNFTTHQQIWRSCANWLAHRVPIFIPVLNMLTRNA